MALADIDESAARRLADELRAGVSQDSVLGRIAEPDDIAAVIVFLASDEARHITGSTIDVNGGHILV